VDAYTYISSSEGRLNWQGINHALFNGLPDEAFDRMGHGTGTANDATVRALAYHIAEHELHHINIIKEKYLEGK
jgi:hypothetical protein